jgi:hypothetical protein
MSLNRTTIIRNVEQDLDLRYMPAGREALAGFSERPVKALRTRTEQTEAGGLAPSSRLRKLPCFTRSI